jgi:hypothetical protein
MNVEQIVEQIARLGDNGLQDLAQSAMQRGVAIPLEFALHTAQLDACMEDEDAI